MSKLLSFIKLQLKNKHMDCGEEIRVIANAYSSTESLCKAYEQEFVGDFYERYAHFLIRYNLYL